MNRWVQRELLPTLRLLGRIWLWSLDLTGFQNLSGLSAVNHPQSNVEFPFHWIAHDILRMTLDYQTSP